MPGAKEIFARTKYETGRPVLRSYLVMIGRGFGDGGEPIGAVPRIRMPLVYPNSIDARRGGTVAQCNRRQVMLMLWIFAGDAKRMLVMEFAGRHALDPHQTTARLTRPGDAHFFLFRLFFFFSSVTQMTHSQRDNLIFS